MQWPAPIRRWWLRWTRQPTLGQRGERAAERFLVGAGYKIVARGYRTRRGEIDLVAVDGRTVVFVEVKSSLGQCSEETADPETAAERVNKDKQQRLTRLALAFMRRHELLECASRFDVVAVQWSTAAKAPKIEHFRDAFAAQARSMFS